MPEIRLESDNIRRVTLRHSHTFSLSAEIIFTLERAECEERAAEGGERLSRDQSGSITRPGSQECHHYITNDFPWDHRPHVLSAPARLVTLDDIIYH